MVGQTFNVNVSVEGPFNCEVKAKSGGKMPFIINLPFSVSPLT
jgi:hypothetical protein